MDARHFLVWDDVDAPPAAAWHCGMLGSGSDVIVRSKAVLYEYVLLLTIPTRDPQKSFNKQR